MNTSSPLNDICFVLQKHQFRIDSNSNVAFSVITDNIQGIMFKNDGDSIFTTPRTSEEVVGASNNNNYFKEGVPSKIITAKNGDIVLDAVNGNVVIRAKNVHIEGNDALGGQVVIDSNRMTSISSPITNVQGDKITLSAASELSAAGGSTGIHAQISNESTTATDAAKSGFLGQILSSIQKFSEFFKAICS